MKQNTFGISGKDSLLRICINIEANEARSEDGGASAEAGGGGAK